MKSRNPSTQTDPTLREDGEVTNKTFLRFMSLGKFLTILVIASLLLRLHLIFVYEINWDEFLHLSKVYNYERGDMRGALQSIFVHGFRWVDAVSANEVDQIIAARLVIYALGVATVGFLFLICRRFLPVHAALFAVLCYLSFSFVLQQGNSFRTDPIATFLLMAALWLIVCKPLQLRYALIVGGLIGLAGMITIKSILYVPTIAVILLIELYAARNRRNVLLYGLATGGIAILSFLTFYLLHRLTLTGATSTLAVLEGAATKTLGERDFGNAVRTFRLALLQNPLFWFVTGMGIFACLRGLIRSTGHDAVRWAILLSFAVMLGSLFVYSQSFPYYYPFMLAPVAVLCGVSLTIIPGSTRSRVTAIASIAIGLTLLGHYFLALGKDTAAQRRTLEVVHQAFPEPVPYIDRSSMVSAYPKRGFFMSVWGMTGYYRTGVPIMRSVIEQDQPRFLIANRRMLELDDLGPEEYGPQHFGLFKEDVATLKANYIRHWGAIYVAGKKFSLSRGNPSQVFEILIEGTYTVESSAPVMLDGSQVQPDDVITLAIGPHRMEMLAAEADVVLRWGDHLYRPPEAAPEGPLFNGF